MRNGLISEQLYEKLRNVLKQNLKQKDFVSFDFGKYIVALEKDKKNKTKKYGFIVPISEGEVELRYFDMNEKNNTIIQDYFTNQYGI